MKILTRILIILAAVAVVVGAFWWIGNSSLASSFGGGDVPGSDFAEDERPSRDEMLTNDEMSEGFEGRGHDEHSGGRGSWAGFLEALVPITIIIAVGRLAALIWDMLRRRKFPKPAI